MDIVVLKSKLAYVKIASTDLYYDGSLGIDKTLMERVNIIPYEQLHVLNVTNGNRFITYAIEEPEGSNCVSVYGAAAKLCDPEDELIILTYAHINSESESVTPIVINFRDQ